MTTHTLKTWPGPFEAVWEEKKRFEFRKNDRNFEVGDRLTLREWVPIHEEPCDWYSDYDEQQTSQDDIYCRVCKRKKKESLAGEYTG